MNTIVKTLAAMAVLLIFISPVQAAVNSAVTCTEAANALLSGASSRQAEQSRSTSAAREIRWTSPEGHEGVCAIDDQGRVFEVRITRFPQLTAEPYRLNCSSKNYRRQNCALRGPATVQLERQMSKSRCTKGQTWDVSDTTLWVDNGCSGQFRATPLPVWTAYTVQCESKSNRRTNCPIEAGAVVRLTRQLSKSSCQQGSSWGQSGKTLWVDRGCRGVFDIRPWSNQQPGFDSSREQARRMCAEEARKHRFTVDRTRIIETGLRHFDVEIDAKRDRVAMELMCRYQVNEGTARLYSY